MMSYFSNWQYSPGPFGMGFLLGMGSFLMFAIIIWSIYWKGAALWRAAKRNEKGWFIALLIINTLGILEILYIYIFSKKPIEEKNPTA